MVWGKNIKIGNEHIGLKHVLYIPNFGKKIISTNKVLENGGTMIADKYELDIKIHDKILKFKKKNHGVLRYLSEIKSEKEINCVMRKNKVDINDDSI